MWQYSISFNNIWQYITICDNMWQDFHNILWQYTTMYDSMYDQIDNIWQTVGKWALSVPTPTNPQNNSYNCDKW